MKEKGSGKYHDRSIDGDGFSLLQRGNVGKWFVLCSGFGGFK